MKLNRSGFMWMAIILECSLVLGVVLYGLVRPDGIEPANEGGLVQSMEADTSLLFQEEEMLLDEDDVASEGGPYAVAPFYYESIYRAKNGDNLWTIAKKNSLDFYTLLSVNRMQKANKISIGQEVKIPNQRGLLYTVRKGDTLEDIALDKNVSIRKIIRVNRIMNPSAVKPGTDLFLPGAEVSHKYSKQLLRDSGIPPQFAWPCRKTARKSSNFGYRKDPFTKKRAFHSGADFAPGYGASVYASMNGRVTYAGYMGGYGKLVVIKHANGYSTRYSHMSRILVRKGKYVSQGKLIGKVGNTGRSTGPHLHFEIRKNGKPQNPMKSLQR